MKRTPLGRKTPLTGGQPLKRASLDRLRSGLKGARPERSRTTKSLQIPDDVRQVMYLSDGGVCLRCGIAWATDQHHRQPRGLGGSTDPRINSPANLVSLCRSCHEWAESYHKAANALGFRVRRPLDPATVRVFARGRAWTYLTPSGSFSDLPPSAEGNTL